VPDYIACWCTGLNKLTSAGHPFDPADTIQHFVNHLLYGSTFELVLFGLSTARVPDQLPSFESVVECVTNIDLNHSFFQPSHQCYSNAESTPNTTPTNTNNSSKDTPASTSTMNSTQLPCPPQSAVFCTSCQQTGHTIHQCPTHGGGQGGHITDQNKMSAHAYLVDVDADVTSDGGAQMPDQCPPDPPLSDVVNEDLSTSFSALGATSFVPSTSTLPVNNNIYFDLYQPSVMPTTFLSLANLSPSYLSSINTLFNFILDSGCTHHIIQDRLFFWTYDTSHAIQVKTANCGMLETLAKGDVKVCLLCGTKTIVLAFWDCLHAPSTPINLISVGTMQE